MAKIKKIILLTINYSSIKLYNILIKNYSKTEKIKL